MKTPLMIDTTDQMISLFFFMYFSHIPQGNHGDWTLTLKRICLHSKVPVDKLANLYNIHLRTGCFCNTGGCQQHLGISNEDVKKNLKAGHVCGDSLDLIDGRPTGSVRISFGYMSTFDDAQKFLKFILGCFVKQPVCFDKDTLSKLERCGTMRERDESQAEHLTDEETTKISSEIAAAQNSARIEIPLSQNCSDNQLELVENGETSKLIKGSESITLTNIYLYPIKSCAAVEVKKWPVGKHGLLYDRTWMIVNQNAVCLSQKQEPRLCLIHPHVDLEEGIMTISAEGMDPIEVPLEGEDRKEFSPQFCQTRVCGDSSSMEASSPQLESVKETNLRCERDQIQGPLPT
ncbi:molybdenum cofactor sulfurase-like [Rhincodon typus]|uniref:molybdenum cofactor sulfurase-like n=1 Tax=Rhincodon typus TaxID=259920 RepID=UPI002030EC52|nr:molybdenum cofactor sulfurase-like [Rhincodon typus]